MRPTTLLLTAKQQIVVSVTRTMALRACVVGAGPAGYYSAQRLLKSNESLSVDLIDKLPVPFGLVRFGVAPDHPDVKNVINAFTQTATKYSDRCRFIGNVEVGKDVSVAELKRYYSCILLSYGAESDRSLGIPGEENGGVYSAREFVGWYNGHPDFTNLRPDLSNDTAVVIGHGNVALDIARILLMPISELQKTDICLHALEAIKASKVRHVHLVGRRGPLQVAFTIKELREMTKLPYVNSIISADDLKSIETTKLARPRRRLTELMIKISNDSSSSLSNDRSWQLHFLRTPMEILSNNNHVSGIRLQHNVLVGTDVESQKAQPTDLSTNINCGLVIRSIGYKSIPLDESIPFNSKTHTIPNERGRVIGTQGLYCSGWVKRGPVGVIATTMNDAFETADCLLEDINAGNITTAKYDRDFLNFLHNKTGKVVTSFSDWERIDREEMERGQALAKSREKIVTVDEMLKIAKE